ncbi:hypothetical protein GQ457_03G019390 [Hibiscus cannabinus]
MFWGLTGFTALEGYFDVLGSILEVGNDVLLLGNGWVMIRVWVVRARNWKLRGGENRLSGLLEGVSVSGKYFYMVEQRFDDVWGLRLGLVSQSKL